MQIKIKTIPKRKTKRAIKRITQVLMTFLFISLLSNCNQNTSTNTTFDTIIRGGTIYDGLGGNPFVGDIGINNDKIAVIGDLSNADAKNNIDASGKAVSPGFINMLSWAVQTLAVDGRGLSDLKQGVTLEVYGEGLSMGPMSEALKQFELESFRYRDIPFEVEWRSLNDYLEFLETKGVSVNVASFVGATTLRINHIGFDNRAPTGDELEAMKKDVRVAMEEGAMGLGSSLIYAPAFFAKTDELVAMAKVVGEYDGMYISHLRSEGAKLIEALDELIYIAESAGVSAEVYHLKAAGSENWHKLPEVFSKIAEARKRGLNITADMYPYTAAATGLDAAMPPWVQEGGYQAWASRLKDPSIREKVIEAMQIPTKDWENLYLGAGAEGILFIGFKNPDLRKYVGKTLAQVAQERSQSTADTAIDLVIEDGSRVEAVYFLMSEENVRKQVILPWVSFGSDELTYDPKLDRPYSAAHPRAYGSFARVLGKYVREEKMLSLAEAIRKMSYLPATNLKLRQRGALQVGYYADIVVFDPNTIQDHATFTESHQLATGVEHVWVNGEQVLKNGEHTGATPGRVVRGPGWLGWSSGE